ncbi:hypothetical protein DN410_03740 [Bacillus sp. SH5-2]|nr:hypothetical protein DN410_03740 [Bacillus sp. SH5-2]
MTISIYKERNTEYYMCVQSIEFVLYKQRAASKSYLPRFEGGINCYRLAYSKNVQNFGIYSGPTKKSTFK